MTMEGVLLLLQLLGYILLGLLLVRIGLAVWTAVVTNRISVSSPPIPPIPPQENSSDAIS